MNEINHASPSSYFDLNSLNDLRHDAKSGQGNEKEALRKAAQHFESIFMNMLLKSMRKANEAFESDSPFNSESTKFYQDMHDQQLTMELSSNGSLGLADLIVEQLSPDYKNYRPASTLRADATLNNPVASLAEGESIKRTTNTALPTWINQQFLAAQKAQAKLDEQTSEVSAASNSARPEFDSQESFIESLWHKAKSAAEKLNLNPAVMIAQAALETGWGKHIINTPNGESSNNLFNIKAGGNWQGDSVKKVTLEYEDGIAVKKNAAFRAYQNIEESFDDFVNFLSSGGRYQEALKESNNMERFLHKLQEAGYATDPNYAKKIIGILNSDGLQQGVKRMLSNEVAKFTE
ncbi:flagellar assembly peptidoglycan hydrolase FlgJ [Pseudoalteromonas tunicata]|jgi:flagellar protein FlgJ|uniref:Peptidoglycan hydrolase FlgJ n=1 Tax=Pseudoalteromonas tunicata D2 TaxID=87626 RepID=A4C6G4_9GAMM|nr:flagellar assembly peptidoglycan hydrolase FlgJ [Pseudoalteromonas tunicata]ATC95542.1 flagellar protein FlgJ [Pseudoalteromonas tunicata]AXT31115.1 flagellar assembly peptidoglycan hydrolase FlgJ [Pseudoalteromonas tunicata]EAR29568.1 putative flagellar biosynthesis [Pseudoalteromonas tunicata D2]